MGAEVAVGTGPAARSSSTGTLRRSLPTTVTVCVEVRAPFETVTFRRPGLTITASVKGVFPTSKSSIWTDAPSRLAEISR